MRLRFPRLALQTAPQFPCFVSSEAPLDAAGEDVGECDNSVGGRVGEEEGKRDGDSVGNEVVGAVVGTIVGATVGERVGESVGAIVGAIVGIVISVTVLAFNSTTGCPSSSADRENSPLFNDAASCSTTAASST